MQFHLSSISLLAAATLFASPIIAAPAPAPAPAPVPDSHPVLFGSPSGHDAGNSACFKDYFYGPVACPGRWYEDGTCCMSDDIEHKAPKEKEPKEPKEPKENPESTDSDE